MTEQMIDLSKLSAEQLDALLRDGTALKEQRRKEEVESAKAEILEIAQKNDIKVYFKEKAPRKTRAKKPPVYRHPKTGKTWNGIGATPKFIKEYEAGGGKREDMLIDKEA